MKQLLEAGVHFGHQSKRWNPKMKPFIFTKRKNIHILDLQLTIRYFQRAIEYVTNLCAEGGTILFLGTKKQAQETIKQEAERCGMPYINQRWLGGTLTNFSTVSRSIDRLYKINQMIESGLIKKLPTKERNTLIKERDKKEKLLGGIKQLKKLPDAIFVIDVKKDEIGIFEARKMNIPVVAVLDTNADPDIVDYGIPGNDDAIRAIQLFCSTIAAAVIDGRSQWEKKMEEKLKEQDTESAAEAANDEAEEGEIETMEEETIIDEVGIVEDESSVAFNKIPSKKKGF
ncbi:30S ribosomal protein S2 [Candidatus Dependentiae bacterium]|nr:30S ribosomal protein S2 [Candidatus Dependentiae bacterium]